MERERDYGSWWILRWRHRHKYQLLLLLLIMLFISRPMHLWRVYILPYVRLIHWRLHLFQSFSCFISSQYLLLFLKSSRGCIHLFPTPFSSVICPSMAPWRRQFLLKIWPIQLSFQRKIWFRSALSFPKRSRTCSLATYSGHCIFSILFQHRISKLSKYFRSNFLSVQVSEP